jgi:glycosyltransferase involved in cell wall biosynthesis
MKVSIIIPAKNESGGLSQVLPLLVEYYPEAEVIVVDDGSTDSTENIALSFGVKLVRHPYSKGNGAAIKSGARVATGDVLVFMDADGQHRPEDIPLLMHKLLDGNMDMVVGARSVAGQAGVHRAAANGLYNRLSSWMVGHRIEDLTSGFRVVKAELFRKFLYLLPNGFSYPNTSTMCFFRAGYSVAYVSIVAPKRIGRSHVRLLRDGARFALIIFKIGTLYSPLKLFLPISFTFFLTGLGYYAYTFTMFHRFTNMSALMLITSVLVFLVGLVSEQVSALNFKDGNG